jgi:hypothetical protein
MTALENRGKKGENNIFSMRSESIPCDNRQTLHLYKLKGAMRHKRNMIQAMKQMSSIKIFK